MRILCHAQHLSGVGHLVRMQAIARGLATRHEVALVAGGRPVPRPASAIEPHAIPLTPLVRAGGVIRGVDRSEPAAELLAERARALAAATEQLRPDVIVVDHYPFSKWELAPEIDAAVASGRRANPRLRVLASLRDVLRKTRHEDLPQDAYEADVLALLHERFDGLLVHADPAFTRLDDHFARAAEIRLPVVYTGFVCEPAGPPIDAVARPARYAVLSAGGESDAVPFLRTAIEAFARAAPGAALAETRLLVFPGPFLGATELADLHAASTDPRVEVRAFSAEFPRWLEGAALSISRAGYNTSVQLLRTRVRAVVVPDARMSDQVPRARRLGELGLATVVEGAPPGLDALTRAIETAASAPAPASPFDLDGINGTCRAVEALAAPSASVGSPSPGLRPTSPQRER